MCASSFTPYIGSPQTQQGNVKRLFEKYIETAQHAAPSKIGQVLCAIDGTLELWRHFSVHAQQENSPGKRVHTHTQRIAKTFKLAIFWHRIGGVALLNRLRRQFKYTCIYIYIWIHMGLTRPL